jgi:hypothetical protein
MGKEYGRKCGQRRTYEMGKVRKNGGKEAVSTGRKGRKEGGRERMMIGRIRDGKEIPKE